MIYQNLFPIGVGSTFLEREFTENEINFLNVLGKETNANIGNESSKNSYIFDNEELNDLKKFCEDKVNKYFQEIYQPVNDVSLYITQSWLNFTEAGKFHHQHRHQNSFISGCIYVDVEKNIDKINFYNPVTPNLIVEPKSYNLFNSAHWWIGVENKQLLLFPSSLVHSVEATESKKTRISIAFNTFFKGTIGSKKDLTELKL